jgi:nucleotide-binding universal stress UspA family protein
MSRGVRATKVFSAEREIVVGVDGSEHSTDALKWAVREAKLREAVLRPICVAPIGSDVAFDWSVADSLGESQEIVDNALGLAEALEPTVVVRGEVLVGQVAELLVGASEVTDLLVLGARGRGALSDLLLGSVSGSCAHRAKCPVVIVHELAQSLPPNPPSRIVVEVDKNGASAALEWAIEEAVLRSASVDVIFDSTSANDNQESALPNPECNEVTSESTRFTSRHIQSPAGGTPFASRVRCVSTVNALLEVCEGADLLVISETDIEGKHQWGSGSFLRRCVQMAPCPVVVVRPSISDRATRPAQLGTDT